MDQCTAVWTVSESKGPKQTLCIQASRPTSGIPAHTTHTDLSVCYPGRLFMLSGQAFVNNLIWNGDFVGSPPVLLADDGIVKHYKSKPGITYLHAAETKIEAFCKHLDDFKSMLQM